ncbi:DM13 domain-containing protein [Leifsonia sp. 2MCAF36]|uniref:DM13 domain-containing protein n=1 Tax=Leifsonia sp. 2MCAF36 TaxID=3232988 RepID=UPI003F96FFFF
MRKALIAGGLMLALSATLTACSTASDATAPSSATSSTSSASSVAADSRTGTFAGLNDKHVAGTVSFAGGKLNLAGFSSDEGPDLHVYLTNGTDEAAVAAGKQIDSIVFNSSTQSFDLGGVQTSGYTDVVIHCDKAKAVFGAAALK